MNKGFKASIIGLMTAGLLVGCSNSSSQKQETKISKSELENYLFKEVNMTADLLDKYSDSAKIDKNLMKPQAHKMIKANNKIIKKIKNNSINKHQTQKLVAMSEASNKWAGDIEKDNFDKTAKEQMQWEKNEVKARKSLKISENSKKYDKYVSSINHWVKTMKNALAKEPHIDKKNMTVITSDEKIQFTSTQIVPGYEGDIVVLAYYTVTNLSDEAKEPYNLLLDAGDFEQDDGDTYKDTKTGIVDIDWEDAHPDYTQMSNDSVESKIKPKATVQSVASLEIANKDNPLLFRAKDEENNTKLGTLKIPLNYSQNQ